MKINYLIYLSMMTIISIIPYPPLQEKNTSEYKVHRLKPLDLVLAEFPLTMLPFLIGHPIPQAPRSRLRDIRVFNPKASSNASPFDTGKVNPIEMRMIFLSGWRVPLFLLSICSFRHAAIYPSTRESLSSPGSSSAVNGVGDV